MPRGGRRLPRFSAGRAGTRNRPEADEWPRPGLAAVTDRTQRTDHRISGQAMTSSSGVQCRTEMSNLNVSRCAHLICAFRWWRCHLPGPSPSYLILWDQFICSRRGLSSDKGGQWLSGSQSCLYTSTFFSGAERLQCPSARPARLKTTTVDEAGSPATWPVGHFRSLPATY